MTNEKSVLYCFGDGREHGKIRSFPLSCWRVQIGYSSQKNSEKGEEYEREVYQSFAVFQARRSAFGAVRETPSRSDQEIGGCQSPPRPFPPPRTNPQRLTPRIAYKIAPNGAPSVRGLFRCINYQSCFFKDLSLTSS